MKLIFAIVQDEDVDNLVDALVSEGFRTTRIGSTGSFLRMGNSSLMIGVDDHQVPQVTAIVRRTRLRLNRDCSTCRKTLRLKLAALY
jgi:uncharacterized protein YaaQ